VEELPDEFDPVACTEFDGALGRLLGKCEGDAVKFLTGALGYLQRKSNFFKEADPKSRVLEAFQQVSARRPTLCITKPTVSLCNGCSVWAVSGGVCRGVHARSR
jgi:hypothetical protein